MTKWNLTHALLKSTGRENKRKEWIARKRFVTHALLGLNLAYELVWSELISNLNVDYLLRSHHPLTFGRSLWLLMLPSSLTFAFRCLLLLGQQAVRLRNSCAWNHSKNISMACNLVSWNCLTSTSFSFVEFPLEWSNFHYFFFWLESSFLLVTQSN